MKSTLRRALASPMKLNRWSGLPDDLDGIYFSVRHLRGLAIKLRASARSSDHSRLRDALEKLPVSIDGNDLDGGIVLHAELESVAGLLRDVVEEWGDDPSGWPSSSSSVIPAAGRSEETPLHTKERESLLKLVIGMAVDGYGYDPSKAKSPVPGEIASELHKLDLSLSVSGRFEPRSM